MDNYNKELENNLLEMIKQKEQADKRLLSLEILVGVLCILPLLVSVIVVSTMSMEEWLGGLIVVAGVLPLLLVTPFMLKIEQVAGYYECKKCGNRYVPTYMAVNMAPHMGRTRYMRCPKCNKKSWQKKVLSKE